MRARLLNMPRWALCAIALFWLAIGYANLARGLAHPGVAYRPWAFAHHAYSDILAMSGDRYLGGSHPAPYLRDRLEYPALVGLALWAPSWLPGGQPVHFTMSYLFLALCLFGALMALYQLPGANPLWLAATPALVYYAGLNWDLLPIALLVGAVAAHEQGRAGASGAVCALGVSAKLWPIALLPAAGAALARRRDRRPLARGALAFGAVTLAVNLPLGLLAPEGWSWFFQYNRQRPAENSVWEALGVRSAAILNPLTFALVIAVAAAAALLAWRCAGAAGKGDGGRAVRLGTALVVVAWIATNKVWSPQYALYAFAAGALIAAPAWLFLLLSAISAIDYHLAFEVRSGRALFWFFDRTYYAEELVRTAVYAAFIAWVVREMVRTWRAQSALAVDLRSTA